jgi:hypothetical protein
MAGIVDDGLFKPPVELHSNLEYTDVVFLDWKTGSSARIPRKRLLTIGDGRTSFESINYQVNDGAHGQWLELTKNLVCHSTGRSR